MATLMVINGQATLNVQMSNDDLMRLLNDVDDRIEAGQGFWARSAGDNSTGPQAIWVPPGCVVRFEFDRGSVPPGVS